MKPVVTQSLDSLLGVVAPQNPQAGARTSDAGAALFGDLLGLLMAAQPVNTEMQQMVDGMPTGDTNADPLALLTPANNNQNTSILTTGFGTQINPELLNQFQMPQGVNLSEGMLVTSMTESDSSVTFTLTPVADQTKPIMLTISKEVFTNMIQQLQSGDSPIADAYQAISPAMLQALLTKLNTKEVTIANAPQLPSSQPALTNLTNTIGTSKSVHVDEKAATLQLLKEMPVAATVSLVAADAEPVTEPLPGLIAPKTAKPVLPQFGVATTQTKTADIATAVTPVAKNTDENIAFVTQQTEGEANGELTALLPEKAKDGLKVEQFSNLLGTTTTAQSTTTLKANTEVAARPVLQLPENIQDLLKPYGKTVTLKIEPEHLGTAILSLQMQQGALRARVVVETTEAKNLLENSLGQLVNQLSKSNIKVDSVEVQIGGQTVTDQQARQQHQQQRSFRTNKRFIADKHVDSIPAALSVPTSAISRYAHKAVSGGLNLVV